MPSPETFSAEELINETVDNAGSSQELIADLNRRKELLEDEEKRKVDAYVKGVRHQINDMLVKDLGPNVGGRCTGSTIEIGKSSLYVFTTTNDANARIEEASEHEHYHQEHNHMAPMIAGEGASGATIVTIGGHAFTDTALIEGITVDRTGDAFVSETYKHYQQDLRSAVTTAGISIDDVEEAIDAKDLRLIDDQGRDAVSVTERNSPPSEPSSGQ